MMMKRYLWCLTLLIERFFAGANLSNCPKRNIKFEKVLGVRPSAVTTPPLLLYQKPNTPVTSDCISKCQLNEDCLSFILIYNTSSCYWFQGGTEGAQELDNVFDTDVAWFRKVCLEASCDKLWVFERIPGATLIGNDTKTLPMPLTRTDCQQYCLNETSFVCKSTKYKITNSNYGPNAQTTGECVLSNADRHLLVNAYRVSGYDEEYFENQCHDPANSKNEFCAYEEFTNVTLAHADEIHDNQTKNQCENLCETTTNFTCRGYSTIKPSICLLHSEDSKVHGPKLLLPMPQSTYYEKATCINITVACSPTYMTVRYNPDIHFMGRIYMQGYSEHPECYALGQGKNIPVTLKLPLLSSQCGITKANGPLNRTLLSGTMILQYNSLIQTQGDRLIRVGCIFGNETKILLGTGVTISSSLLHKGSTIVTSTSNVTTGPVVEMRVIDLNTQEEVSDTQIGQELQLVIEIKPPNGPYDIWASHLIAMTEKNEESIFLLDDRGCPTSLNVFPAIEKVVTNNSRKLVATFQAFKFAASPIVRFSVIVQFCPKECPAIDCTGGVSSFGKRRKREMETRLLHTITGTKVIKVNRSEFEDKANINELPLEFVMVVRDPQSNSERLFLGENKILVAGYNYSTNEVCMDYSFVVGIILTWIIVQIVFVVCCIVLVRRYKRYYAHECTRQSLEELHKNFGIGFSNLENRRVHWADNGDIT